MYTDQSGRSVLAEFSNMTRRHRREMARRFIYKKGIRPKDLAEQLLVLEALETDEALTSFDHFYALIAGAHKICEQVDMPRAKERAEKMWLYWPNVRSMPVGYGLRKDRTHLVFSYLNVAMNLDILSGGRRSNQWTEIVLQEVEKLNPRQMTPYLFNSNSNVIKALGLAALSCPEDVDRIHDISLKLVSYGIEINNPVFWWFFSRFRAPSHMTEVKPRAGFGSHLNTMRRVFALEEARHSRLGPDRQRALHKVADLCVAQANPVQKQALIGAVEKRSTFSDLP